MPIKIFLHICAISRAASVMLEMIQALHLSGLYKEAETIFCYLSGEEELGKQIVELLHRSGAKFRIVKFKPGDNTYERLTLCDMHQHIQADDKVLYMHSKGVSNCYKNPSTLQKIDDWRYLMLYHLVGRFRECLKYLDEYDTVGCNLGGEIPHYSGNFWWVRGSYFLTLPTTLGNDYLDPELRFLFVNNPSAKCIYTSKINHYHVFFEPAKYVDLADEQ